MNHSKLDLHVECWTVLLPINHWEFQFGILERVSLIEYGFCNNFDRISYVNDLGMNVQLVLMSVTDSQSADVMKRPTFK